MDPAIVNQIENRAEFFNWSCLFANGMVYMR